MDWFFTLTSRHSPYSFCGCTKPPPSVTPLTPSCWSSKTAKRFKQRRPCRSLSQVWEQTPLKDKHKQLSMLRNPNHVSQNTRNRRYFGRRTWLNFDSSIRWLRRPFVRPKKPLLLWWYAPALNSSFCKPSSSVKFLKVFSCAKQLGSKLRLMSVGTK